MEQIHEIHLLRHEVCQCPLPFEADSNLCSINLGHTFFCMQMGGHKLQSKARFHVTVITQVNKSVVYFIVTRNVKFGCSEC